MKSFFRVPVLRIVAIYAIFSAAWIYISDRILSAIASDSAWLTQIQTYKGWIFIAVSSAIIFYLIQSEHIDRQQVETELLINQASFQELFANNPSPMWVYDQETLGFLEVNEAAIQKYGYSRDDFWRMTVMDLSPPEDQRALQDHLRKNSKALRNSGQWKHLTRNGKTLTVQVISHSLIFNDRPAALVIAEDISYSKSVESAFQSAETKRIAAENSLRLDEMRLEALLKLSQMSQASLKEITDFALHQAIHLTDSAEGYLAFVNHSNSTITFQSKTSLEAVETQLAGLTRLDPNDPDSLWHKILAERRPLILNERDSVSWKFPPLDGEDHHTVRQTIIPVIEEDDIVAVAVVRDKVLPYTEADVRQLTLLMDGLWKVIERNRMIEALQTGIVDLKQHERSLQAIVDIAAALRSTANRSEMISILFHQFRQLFSVEGIILVCQDPRGQDYRIESGAGKWAGLSGLRIGKNSEITTRVIENQEIFWTNQMVELSDPIMPVLEPILTSGICVPLVAEKIEMGAIWAGTNSSLSQKDIDLLKTLTDIAANAIHRAMLNEETELNIQRLTILRAIDMAISSSLDVRVTLNILLNQVSMHLNIDAALVLLYSAQTQTLEYSAGRGFKNPAVKSVVIRMGQKHAGKVALERKMEFIPDLHQVDDQLSQYLSHLNEDFTSYICLPLISKGQIKGVLELFQCSRLDPGPDWFDFLEAVAAQAAIAIDNAEMFDQLQRSNTDLTLAYDATIEGWSRALELRSEETQGHTKRVTELTLRLARELGLQDDEILQIRRGVLLHDIGKMAIPDEILKKGGTLTEEEWDVMRKHPIYAYEMLSSIPYLQKAIDIPYCHHERWDGKGYPRGLAGEQIPLSARIFSIVDIWDALRNDRVYRCAWPEEKVLHYIHEQAGRRLDPNLVEAFTRKIDKIILP